MAIIGLRGVVCCAVSSVLCLDAAMALAAPCTRDDFANVVEPARAWHVAPFAFVIFYAGLQSVNQYTVEAALIDGAGYLQMLWKIFIPVAMPGIIAATIFSFTVAWAQFLYPLAFTTSTTELVLPVGVVTTLIKGDVFNWGQIMTGALLGAAPPLII